jgi:uncharacterized protein YjbJ (UPF0337 family)
MNMHTRSNHPFLSLKTESIMNKDALKGALKDAAGKVQDPVGKATGSAEQQRKVLHKPVDGKAQKADGKVKEMAHK